MRILPAVLFAIVTTLTAFPDRFQPKAERAESLRLRNESLAEKTRYLQSRNELHERPKGPPFPTTLTEAGLLDDAAVVWSGFSLDGGSRGYLIKDSAGNYLAFCTDPGLQIQKDVRKVIRVKPRFYVGGLHYTHEGVKVVEPGSKCEQFLKTLARERKSITDDPANAELLTSLPLDFIKLAKE
jgi:hypothetical protein